MTQETKRRGRTILTAALLFVLALVSLVAAQIPPCGDGFLDGGEECDEGLSTGAVDSCCAIDCTFRPALTPCRDTTGECDPADVCSGTSGVCDDGKRADECRPAAGVCDVAESCDGVASDCPADAKSTASCRAGSGVCDTAESCDGIGNDCPANGFASALIECRASAGICDVAEHCTGSSATCPGDAKSTASCRASAGVCDLGEICDGVGNDCPANGFVVSSFVCRSATGVCDVAEHCTGSSAACPANGFVSAVVECRPAAGTCDASEHCTGASPTCPVDAFQPDETPCNDANVCSINDRCIGGICGGFLENCGNGTTEGICLEDCDDGNLIPGDGCDASCRFEPCGPAPIAGCRPPATPDKAAIQIVSRLNPEKNSLQWKYSPGATTPKADFGDPITTTSYQFCLYEEIGGNPRLSASYAIPAGDNWRLAGKGFKYINKAHTPQGISGITLKEGLAPGKSKIILKGRGELLPVPVLPLIQSSNVVVQLKASNGVCWETRYGMPAFRNQPDQFRDK